MCGIVASVNWGDASCLRRMTSIQAHRGPDDEGHWEHCSKSGTWVGLGSRRLAILDLSPAGHMPMSNEDGSIWITYNGEVYNFRELRAELAAKGHSFRSDTDTEVVLHLYEECGASCVERLNGMFSFAICDLRQGEPVLFFARDHFGIKPLYYIHQGHKLGLASEAKALLELPGLDVEVDLEALNQYMTLLWVPDPKTLFRGILKLPAGHWALFRGGDLLVRRYWDLEFPSRSTRYTRSAEDLSEELRERLRASVRSQMISDVPLGAFLSSGLDSSSIVALMAEASDSPVRTYTITFPPRYRVGETTIDDPSVADLVAERYGCIHKQLVVEPNVVDLLPKLVWHMDEPTADPAIITAYLVCREARHEATVLLSGIGGDELFAGYRKHVVRRWAPAYQRLPSWTRRRVIEPFLLGLPSMRGTPLKGPVRLLKKMARSGSLPPEDAFLMDSTYLDSTQRSMLYSPEMASLARDMDPWQQHRGYFGQVAHGDFLNQMLYVDTKAFMVSLNLTYNDKMSMAVSVETRVPFLDRELVEFAAREVPPDMKLHGYLRPSTKHILRKAMRSALPAAVLRQKKAGFGAPADYWLAHDLQPLVDHLLSPSQVAKRGLFEPRTVSRLVAEQRSGSQDWSLQIWQLLTLELWLTAFVDRCGRDWVRQPCVATGGPVRGQL